MVYGRCNIHLAKTVAGNNIVALRQGIFDRVLRLVYLVRAGMRIANLF